ncbi:hypothetical protein GCM10007874_17670 [Labrys miyagiensis]|uniref:Uncharacterized protein n=1 Tax=Labrys miyagiensis TaxID=346912 RepID=A0ABQ6CFP8_9HYPH|nr:hypothetical protein [Labrys miyagiensis]GLS18750.1 hypothetical protein GCM10007874_17670 [Labrys miyagiensis]
MEGKNSKPPILRSLIIGFVPLIILMVLFSALDAKGWDPIKNIERLLLEPTAEERDRQAAEQKFLDLQNRIQSNAARMEKEYGKPKGP